MTRDEVRQIVWQELQRQVSVVLTGLVNGSSGAASGQSAAEGIASMLPGMPAVGPYPTARPWGMASAPPDGVEQLVARGGPSARNRLILGHFDSAAPPCERGEVVLYNQFGQRVRLKDGAILLGSDASTEPLVLGAVFQAMMSTVLGLIAAHTHSINAPVFSGPTPTGDTAIGTSGVPSNAAGILAQKSSPVDDGAILSGVTFTEK